MSGSEFEVTARAEQLQEQALDFGQQTECCGAEVQVDRKQMAESYVADMLKLGVVPVRTITTADRIVFLDVVIEECRVHSFVRDGRCYITKVGKSKWDLHHRVPYRLATMVKRKDAPMDREGRSEWWITKKGGRLCDGSGPMRLTEAGARTMSVITGIPIEASVGLTEIGRSTFFGASAALQALIDWCKEHPLLAKRNNLSAQDVLEGDFVI